MGASAFGDGGSATLSPRRHIAELLARNVCLFRSAVAVDAAVEFGERASLDGDSAGGGPSTALLIVVGSDQWGAAGVTGVATLALGGLSPRMAVDVVRQRRRVVSASAVSVSDPESDEWQCGGDGGRRQREVDGS